MYGVTPPDCKLTTQYNANIFKLVKAANLSVWRGELGKRKREGGMKG
jgi:hypothetical protein